MTKRRVYKTIEYIDQLPFTQLWGELEKGDFVVMYNERYDKQPDGRWKRVACYEIEND